MAAKKKRTIAERIQVADATTGLGQKFWEGGSWLYDLLNQHPYIASFLTLWVGGGGLTVWASGIQWWLVWPAAPVLFAIGAMGLHFWHLRKNGPPLTDEEPSDPPPVEVEAWRLPLIAAIYLIDPAFEKAVELAQSVRDGIAKQYSDANLEMVAALTKNPLLQPTFNQRQQMEAFIRETKTHLDEAETKLRHAKLRKLLALKDKLEGGLLIGEGFAHPGDRSPTRIYPAEWRKYSVDEDQLLLQRARLGDIEYTGVRIGVPKASA